MKIDIITEDIYLKKKMVIFLNKNYKKNNKQKRYGW